MTGSKPQIAKVDMVSVGDLLDSGRFLIPDFQRPFAWTVDHVREFWEDVLDPNRDAPYFIGPVVLYEDSLAKGVLGVVDGQQRLTTIVLLLTLMRAKATELGLEGVASDLRDKLVLPDGAERLDSASAGEALRAIQQGERETNIQLRLRNRVHKRLRDAREELAAQLQADFAKQSTRLQVEQRLDFVLRSVLDLRVIRSTLADPLRAFTFFETLNSKGADLETVDLLKNLLFERWRREAGAVSSIRDAWEAFIGVLARRRLSSKTMLYHWWLSRSGYVTKRAMYAAIRAEHVKDTADHALQVVNEMEVAARAYAVVARPRATDWDTQRQDVHHLLDMIARYGVAQPRPFMLALVLAGPTSDHLPTGRSLVRTRQLRKALRAIESFHLVYNAISKKSSLPTVSEAYAARAVELTNATSADDARAAVQGMIGDLRDRGNLPTRAVFVATLVDTPRYVNRAGANVVLNRVLELWNEKHGVSMAGRSQLTIEHWQPRREAEPWTNGLGNLALLPEPTNSEDFGSKMPAEKWRLIQDRQADTGGLYVGDLRPTWDREAAEARARLIAGTVYDYLQACLQQN